MGDLNSGLHAEQQALLITEPSSQPLAAGFEIYRCEVSDFVLWFQNCLGYSASWKSSLYFQALSVPRGNPAVVWSCRFYRPAWRRLSRCHVLPLDGHRASVHSEPTRPPQQCWGVNVFMSIIPLNNIISRTHSVLFKLFTT